jgi:RecA-family ATPase
MSQAEQLDDAADELPEIALATFEKIDGWQQAIEKAPLIDKHAMFAAAAADLYGAAYRETDKAAFASIEHSIEVLGCEYADLPPETVDKIMNEAQARAIVDARSPPSFSQTRGDEPPIAQPDDYGTGALAPLPKPAAPAVLKTPAEWPNEEPAPVDWLAFQRIPRGDVTTLHGDGGAGKTDIALRLAANVARGAPDWLGHEIARGPVVLVSAEEPEREIRRRTWLHGQRDGYAPAELTNLFQWFPDNGTADTALATPDRAGIMRPTPLFDSIGVAIHQAQPVLIVVDNVAATFAGNQNDRVMVRTYVNLWRAIARIDSKPAVLLIDHPSLSGLTNGTGRGGNMDWRNAVRSALYLRLPEDRAEADRGIRVLETQKSNYGPSGNPLRLQWGGDGIERENTPSSFHRLAKDAECEQIFLRMLDEREGQGRHVSSEGRASTYAPTAFATMSDNGGFTRKAFAAAMERLLQAGKIVQVTDGPASRQRGRLTRKAAP